MAVTFQQILPYNFGSGGFTSASFTPNASGDTLPIFCLNSATNDLVTAMTGSSTYSLDANRINPAENVIHVLSCASGSQTYTTTCAGGTTRIWMIDYSGVGAANNFNTAFTSNPGSGAGAILGTSVTVPSGSVLVAICVNNNTGTNTITATSGTTRQNGQTSDSWEFCITEYAGTGAAIQPAFTAGTGDGANGFAVMQMNLDSATINSVIAWVV